MNTLCFSEIPQKYELEIRNISDKVIQNLYSKFVYLYFRSSLVNSKDDKENYDKEILIEPFIYNFLKDYKFITYYLIEQHESQKNQTIPSNSSSHPIDVVFCVEQKCLIIKKIKISTIIKIVNKLKAAQTSIINVNNNSSIFTTDLIEMETLDFIDNFCLYFQNQISKKKFIKKTIFPLVGYIIRRSFYPTYYFKDQSFFYFDSTKQEFQSNLKDFFFSNKEVNLSDIQSLFSENSYETKEFKEADFIFLKSIYSNEKFVFNLVIHLESFHLFLMKKLNNIKKYRKEIEHEIKFCKYSHHCLTRFYGFVKDVNQDVFCFIYEFMCNGTLNSFVKNNPKKVNEIFILNTINRIFRGIDYIHSKSLIHRDLKPFNILLDHDFIPFISDFETIRPPKLDENEQITNNIGTFYSSPEQYKGGFVSYPTDVYSFGLIVYFLNEKNDFRNPEILLKENSELPEIKNVSNNIQSLYKNCVKFNQKERLTSNEISKIIFDEINSICSNKNYCFNELTKTELFQFYYESILFVIQYEKQENFTAFFDNLCSYQCQYLKYKKIDDSFLLYNLGVLYEKGFGVTQNVCKAKEYYELAAKKNNSYGLNMLGFFYENGFYCQKDTKKAKEYYELAAKQNNPKSFYSLGYFYDNIEDNTDKAIEYYELAAKFNNSDALCQLGTIYLNDKRFKKITIYSSKENDEPNIVEEEIDEDLLNLYEEKAIEYYELAAAQNNSEALLLLGDYYRDNFESEEYYKKAFEYYELSAKQNNVTAIFRLSDMYDDGKGVKKNHQKAKELFVSAKIKETSDTVSFLNNYFGLNENTKDFAFNLLKLNDYDEEEDDDDEFERMSMDQFYSEIYMKNYGLALDDLANFYMEGYYVKKDISKAIKILEVAMKLNYYPAILKLASIYQNGIDIKQDYLKAIKYYEIAANKYNNPEALFELGNFYFYGYGVKRDFLKAIEYYDRLMKHEFDLPGSLYGIFHVHYKDAYVKLANIYENGYGVPKDYQRAIYYYEQAIKENNADAFVNLGNLYETGLGVDQNYLLAKEYYESGAFFGCSLGYLCLGVLYENGHGVERNVFSARDYYEIAAYRHIHLADLFLGILYEKNTGFYHNYEKSLHFYMLSAAEKNLCALYHLGSYFSKGDVFEIDLPKAIKYFTECIEMHKDNNNFFQPVEKSLLNKYDYTRYEYISSNDLGLIYIIEYNDVDNAFKYLKHAAFADYSFAENNLGLLNEFFAKDGIENAKYFYEKASKHNFALSEFNLGRLIENEGKIEESIEYYIKASNHEDEPLIFQTENIYDKRLEISKTFIICLTNLKLTYHFLSQSKYYEAKSYFIKSFSKINIDNSDLKYKFEFKINLNIYDKNIFIYLKRFILCFPLFNLADIKNLSKEINFFINSKVSDDIPFDKEIIHDQKTNFNFTDDDDNDKFNFKIKNEKTKTNSFDSILYEKQKELNLNDFDCKIMKDSNYAEQDGEYNFKFHKINKKEKTFDDIGKIFDFALNNNKLKNILIFQIKDIIDSMNSILYNTNYSILFGRIGLKKIKNSPKKNPLIKDINKEFYGGLGLIE